MTPIFELPSLATELRKNTRAHHHELDRQPILSRLTVQDVSAEDYATALAALRGPQEALEDALANFAAPCTNNPFQPRLELLDSDLHNLGCAPYPLMIPPPSSHHLESWLGIRYVLEGSRLGGAVLFRHLQPRLSQLPMSFFEDALHNGQDCCARFWRDIAEFQKGLKTEAVIQAAQESFKFYIEHLVCVTNIRSHPSSV